MCSLYTFFIIYISNIYIYIYITHTYVRVYVCVYIYTLYSYIHRRSIVATTESLKGIIVHVYTSNYFKRLYMIYLQIRFSYSFVKYCFNS